MDMSCEVVRLYVKYIYIYCTIRVTIVVRIIITIAICINHIISAGRLLFSMGWPTGRHAYLRYFTFHECIYISFFFDHTTIVYLETNMRTEKKNCITNRYLYIYSYASVQRHSIFFRAHIEWECVIRLFARQIILLSFSLSLTYTQRHLNTIYLAC